MALTLIYQGEERVEELERRVSSIGESLYSVFTEAAEGAVSPVVASHVHAERILERGPRS